MVTLPWNLLPTAISVSIFAYFHLGGSAILLNLTHKGYFPSSPFPICIISQLVGRPSILCRFCASPSPKRLNFMCSTTARPAFFWC